MGNGRALEMMYEHDKKLRQMSTAHTCNPEHYTHSHTLRDPEHNKMTSLLRSMSTLYRGFVV